MQFEFDEQRINLILKGLGTLPYVESARLINEILEQANEQLGPRPVDDEKEVSTG